MSGLLASLMVAAAVWYPAADWQENPDPVASPFAKKGGILRFDGAMSPKSFNAYIDSFRYTQTMFSLMYGQLIATDTDTMEFVPSIASRWSISEDGAVYTFIIDERATWSDGEPVTAHDVKWTFDQVMRPESETGPWKMMLGEFESPVVLDADAERPLQIQFTKKRNPDGTINRNWRDILHCGTFWILPKHAFENQDFNKFDFVGAPVGGPYRISRTEEQVETEYTRVENWWRADLPSCRNTCNFDRILVRYYVGKENAFDAFKKRKIDVYPVYSARIMATETSGYKFERNWIIKRRVFNHEPVGYQGFAMNMRRWPFDDVRVRKAMAKLIDREFMNRTMMYNEYFLQNSFYGDLYDEDHPCPNELLLYDFEGAKQLLTEAGFVRNEQTGKLEKDGRPFKFTFLTREKNDKVLVLFDASLAKLGIEMEIKRKDAAGWMRDLEQFNFDMTWSSMGANLFRNPETSWLSSEADRKTSNNTVGFKSEEVDRIIAAEKTMMSVADREAAYRRIDQLLVAECPYAFLWNIASTRLLYWNKFGVPDTVLSRYGDETDVLTYWWYDADRAEELNEAISRDSFLPSVPERVDFDTVMKWRK